MFSSIKKATNLVIVSALGLGASVVLAAAPAYADSPVFNTKRNCDGNAVVYCGAMSASELSQKYDNSKSVQTIYSYFGISSADVQNLGSTAVAGSVTKSGDVYAGNKLVAKNALTVGRDNISGSKKVTYKGVTFYTRRPSVSFLDNSLQAFVVLNSKGQFQLAILASCGNAVNATNVVPAPKPVPTPTPTPTPAPTPAPKVLPNTGPGEIAGLFSGVSLTGAAAHQLVARRRNR